MFAALLGTDAKTCRHGLCFQNQKHRIYAKCTLSFHTAAAVPIAFFNTRASRLIPAISVSRQIVKLDSNLKDFEQVQNRVMREWH
jgi:hypothetical protein